MDADGEPERLLADLGRRRSFARGEVLFAAGEPARTFHYVRSGEVRVFQAGEDGREVEVGRFRRGDFVGEAVAFAGADFPSSAQAVRGTETLAFDVREVLARVGRDAEAARFFLRLLARKCLVLNERVLSLTLRTVRQRLAQYLLARRGQDGVVRLETPKAELARMLGVSAETLSRTLRRLEEGGAVAVEGRRIRILNPSLL